MTRLAKGRVVSPFPGDLPRLRQPLEDGEWSVLEFFLRKLPADWEIYVQPHLNGLRPDFVLLNPAVGIAVFEVKNWDLRALERWVEYPSAGAAPRLMGKKGGKSFSLQKDNPVEKVLQYKEEITDLYCPRLDRRFGSALVTAGVIFPSADDQEVAELLTPFLQHHGVDQWPQYHPVSGQDALAAEDLGKIFPEATRTESHFMDPQMAADLRLWLVEPDAPQAQRTPLELDEGQKRLAATRTTTGFRRITGPAGSGKSHVLAARAANLIDEGKDVLVVSFNITLLNYLADAAVRNSPKARSRTTWLNFHHWCKRVCCDTGNYEAYRALWRDREDFPDQDLCELVSEILASEEGSAVPTYDAILVDEGQDFQPEWWTLLRKVRRQNGEMLLAADATQDIYEVSGSWTDGAMTGAGFSGNWAQLEVSYRLPPLAAEYARAFGERFLPKDGADLPRSAQMELDVYPCGLRWVQTPEESLAGQAVEEVWKMLAESDQAELAVSDVTVLVDNKNLGETIVELLERANVHCLDTFGASGADDRAKKLKFFMGDARVKVTTLHSFKGWETRALLVCTQKTQGESGMRLIYTGITRVKRHTAGSFMTVVCAQPELASYGETWPDHERVEPRNETD